MNENGFGYFPPPRKRMDEDTSEEKITQHYQKEFPEIENPEDFETVVFPVKKKAKEKKRKAEIKEGIKVRNSFMDIPEGSRFVREEIELKGLHDRRKDWEEYLRPVEEKLDEQVVETIKVDSKDKAAFVANLHNSIESIYQFLLYEVLPIQAAIEPAINKAAQSIALITDTEAVIELDENVMGMIADAMNLKVFDFVADKLCLKPELRKIIQDSYFTPLLNINKNNKK